MATLTKGSFSLNLSDLPPLNRSRVYVSKWLGDPKPEN